MKVFSSNCRYISITGEVSMEGIAEFTQAVHNAYNFPFAGRTYPNPRTVIVSVFDLKFNTKDSSGELKRTLNDTIKMLAKEVPLEFRTVSGKNHDFNFYTAKRIPPPDEE